MMTTYAGMTYSITGLGMGWLWDR